LFPSRQQIKDFHDTMDDCHKKCCESPIGQLLNNGVKPISAMSGGLVPPLCPASAGQPNPDDLKKPPESAAGAAARIKQQEAEASARREAVRYLGTVDCQRFPEAEAALVKALREDTNECVRWEAARALGRGCCCTKKTIDALTLTVNASQKDGNPAEKSERVRMRAADSLQHCLYCYQEPVPDESDRPEKPARPEAPGSTSKARNGIILTAYDARVAEESETQLVERARMALQRHVQATGVPVGGSRSLASIASRAVPIPVNEPPVQPVRQVSASAPVAAGPSSEPPTSRAEPKQPRSLYSVMRSAIGPR
jgi:hypothetical protein